VATNSRLAADERLEEPFADRLGDAGAVVRHREDDLIALLVPGDFDEARLLVEIIDGVGDEVGEDFAELHRVGPDARRLLGQVQLDGTSLGIHPEAGRQRLEDRTHIHPGRPRLGGGWG
jgi:hypothetical protein